MGDGKETIINLRHMLRAERALARERIRLVRQQRDAALVALGPFATDPYALEKCAGCGECAWCEAKEVFSALKGLIGKDPTR